MKIGKLRKKTDGRWCARIEGSDYYFGKDRADAEKQFYCMKAGVEPVVVGEPLYVCDLIERYLNYRETYDLVTDRTKIALRFLNRDFGHFATNQIGMTEVTRLREIIVASRRHVRLEVNRLMSEITRFWKWCAAQELAPAEVHAKFTVLEPLKRGRCDVKESKPVSAVPLEHVRAVQANVRVPVKAIIELQLLTGARPGEILALTVGMIDRSGEVWSAELLEHKTTHLGKRRCLYFGEQAQAVLRPFLLAADLDGHLFLAKNGEPYTLSVYRRAITRACARKKIPHWHPHQLRHTAATELRKRYGVEVARAVLGHSHVRATEIYAEADAQVAERVAAEMG